MTKMAHRIGLICVLTLLGIFVLHAKDLATYRVGDSAETDIVTPIALDVIDPAATAALKSAEAMRTPAIFRVCSDVTNALANQFLAEFAGARSNFTAAVQDAFHQPKLDDATIASPDFGYVLTAFNVKNKNFPITAGLAETWAHGNPGLMEQKRFLDFLLLTMQHAVRPDEMPDNFVSGEIARLVPANSADEKLTLADAEARGKLVTTSSLTTLSQLYIIFRREFTADDEQPLARALTTLLKPNCIPDADLTRIARNRAVSQLIVAEHYDAGQFIVRQGVLIDAKIKAALDQLNEKSAVSPNQLMITGNEGALREPQPTSPPINVAQHDAPQKMEPAIAAQNPTLKISAPENRPNWLTVALTSISVLALLTLWQLISRRRVSLLPARATNLPAQNSIMLHAELAPHLAQVVKEALVQELAMQRRELLVAQQIASAEIIGLVQRLDELQMTMQERVRTYEMQILKLESELAVRTEENHELLKLKIEMIRQQLEVERTRNRMDFN
jgi:7TM-HD extracellular